VGGHFTSVGGQPRSCIAALDIKTGIATAWNPNADNSVLTLAVSSNKVYAGGQFTSIGGQSRSGIAALDISTGKATSWNPSAEQRRYSSGNMGPSGRIHALAVSGNTVYAGGQFTWIGGKEREAIAALDAKTGKATAWNPSLGVDEYILTLGVSGNRVYVGGAFYSIGGQERRTIAAVDAKTGVASAWNPSMNGIVYNLSASGNKVYVGGYFNSMNGEASSNFAILTP